MGDLTDNKRRARNYPKPVLINGLRFFWVCLVVWLEVGVFHWSLRSCHWPDKDIKVSRVFSIGYSADIPSRLPGDLFPLMSCSSQILRSLTTGRIPADGYGLKP
jgi:hypothetical protein